MSQTLGRILLTHPRAVQAHKDIILRCLDDKDESIRLRALDLLYGMVSKKNIVEIIKRLMEHIDHSEGWIIVLKSMSIWEFEFTTIVVLD